MTDISREAIDTTCKSLEYPEFALRPTLTNGRKAADMLRALRDRVDELEKVRIRMLNQKLSGEWHNEVFKEGYQQGLEARPKHMPGMDPVTMGEWEARIRKEALEEAISYLKTQWDTPVTRAHIEGVQALIKQEDGQ